MGPSVLGSTSLGCKVLFPYNSVITLENIANLGIIYYMFLVGLEVDMKPVVRAGKKALSTAIAGLILPVPVGYGLHHLLMRHPDHSVNKYGPLFWGVVLGTTNFPDLARILADHKLLHSDVGRTALSSAVITDIFSWMLFVLAVAVSNDGKIFTVISTALIVLFYIYALAPAVSWMLRKTTKDDQNYSHNHICFILAGVIASAYITDSTGCHSILGAFMFGVILPKGKGGELKHALTDNLEDFVSGLMTPLFFLVIGLRTDTFEVFQTGSRITVPRFLAVTLLALCTKIASTFSAAVFFNKMTPRDGLALGLLMNTKGLLALIITNSARDLMVLSTQTYTVMVIALWLMTAAVGPLIALVYRRTNRDRRLACQYKNKTIRSLELQPDSEFRMLACINSAANVSGLINLLGISNPTKHSPIMAYALHLVELVGHASAMLIVHDTCNITADDSSVKDDHISNALENLERQTQNMTVQSLTAMSSYSTMHEDVCNLAEDKRVALILLPFHKQLWEDGVVREEEDVNSPFRSVNRNVMDNASCSVAIFVDRGGLITTNEHNNTNDHDHDHDDHVQHIAMLFIGGRDDREALAYACRMCGNKCVGVSLTVMRFVPTKEAAENDLLPEDEGDDDNNGDILKAITDAEREKQLDKQYIEGLKLKAAASDNNNSMKIIEVEVNNGDEIIKVLSMMEQQFDMYVVGKGRGARSCLTSGFSDWSEWPELGPLGDILVSSSFAPNTSILVVQQGCVSADDATELAGPAPAAAAAQLKDNFDAHHHMTWHPPLFHRPHFAPFLIRKLNLHRDDDHII
ncbi:cation/H(+) antiporter 15 [Ziziphus jujuba]|uniref:Cation/H(+) antiporter 15 n=1 Tax=Ziziphus jujuba TaxID=326968 RepID=A0A6P6FXI4_ZIZJJ|nr:cation/H(+) antiporter 15 [Ziziphus jujuba]